MYVFWCFASMFDSVIWYVIEFNDYGIRINGLRRYVCPFFYVALDIVLDFGAFLYIAPDYNIILNESHAIDVIGKTFYTFASFWL